MAASPQRRQGSLPAISEPRPDPGRMLAALGVQSGEGRLVVPALALAFLSVGASTLASIGSDALFVSTFSLGELSRFLVLSSAIRVALAAAFASLASREAGPRFDAVFLITTSAVMGASGLVGFGAAPSLIYATCTVLVLLPPLLPLVAFNAVLSCFHARQAKRLLPLCAAAATVGSMVVGASAHLLATRLGAGSLLILGGLLCVASLPFPRLLSERAGQPSLPPTSAPPAGGFLATLSATLGDIRDVPVVRLVVGIAGFSAAAVILIDFAFKAALKERYGRDEMAAFLGSFSLAANGLVLGVQLFLASRLVRRFGVRVSLTAFPVSLIVLGPLLVVAPGVGMAVVAKLAEQIFRYALGGSTGELILTPAPSQVRTRGRIFVKGIAVPAGALGAGVILSLFGEAGPSALSMGALLVAVGVAGVFLTRDARRAYATALAAALGEGRVSLDVASASASILRGELCLLLQANVAAGDVDGAVRILAIMNDRFFSFSDVEPVLATLVPTAGASPLIDPAAALAIRRAAVRAAILLAHPGDAERLLARVPPDVDPTIEREILAAASVLGASVPRARLDRAVAEGLRTEEPARADLWADAQVALAKHDQAAALKALRRAAVGPDSPRRAAALRGLGLLDDRKAEREVLRAMASNDPAVFAEAASAAVRIDAQGAIETLVERLSTGPHVRASARALALAGPRAVNQLIAELPTTRGDRAILATAVASGRSTTGTVRAARVLARLGPEGCARALSRFEDLGYRARNAIARSFASVERRTGRLIDRDVVLSAMELTVHYAETLVEAFATAKPGLLRAELRHRIGETGARVLDLAATMGDRALIARARSALTRDGHHRENALELLENVLPRELAVRTVALLDALVEEEAEEAQEAALRAASSLRQSVKFDGWLEKCAQFDEGTLPSDDAMVSMLEKVIVLRDSSLFAGLSGEELFPVAEIAEPIMISAGAFVVREGDPGDTLFVVVSGTFSILKGATKLREIARGGIFGELALLDGARRAASVKAESDGRLLRIPRAEFEALLDESPELSRGVIRTLLGHLRAGP
jgi:hypothetical protein